MTDEPKHEVITEITPETTDYITIPTDVLIHTSSYYELLGSESKTRQKNLLTDGHSYLADVISCLDVIKDKSTNKLTLTITLDKYGEPKLITKRYTTDFIKHTTRKSTY